MFVLSKICEFLRHIIRNMRFAHLNISILQENATADFSIVLLKIIRVPHVHRTFPLISQKTKILSDYQAFNCVCILNTRGQFMGRAECSTYMEFISGLIPSQLWEQIGV